LSEIKRCEQHNRRLYTKEEMPVNIDPSKISLNQGYIAANKSSFKEAIDDRLQGVAVRSNSVVAIEFVMGASKDFYQGSYDASSYLSNCVEFVACKYGRENIISVHQHFDESNPHVHVLLTPIAEKTVRWKNQKGEGSTTEKRLCARDITGGREKLRQLQDEFHAYIVPFGQLAGVEFVRGTLVEQQTREYKKRTDYRMAEITRIAKLAEQEINAAKRLEFQKQIVNEVGELEKDQNKLSELERKAQFIKKGKSKGNKMVF
jgi:hypothetical protein